MSVIESQAPNTTDEVKMENQQKVLDLPKDLQGFDYKEKYSDKSYQEYIENFQLSSKNKVFYKVVKRAFDIVFAFILLILLTPLMMLATLAICIEMIFCKQSRGSIFFLQERMGENEKPFNCLKFRTMKKNANHDCATMFLGDIKNQYTKVGRVLRRISIDEFPQLLCVLIGTMSLVGPRPVILKEEKLIAMRSKLKVYTVKPGITGWAQVNGRDDVYYKNKAIMDAEYVKKASIWLDIKVLFLTIKVVFSKKGVV